MDPMGCKLYSTCFFSKSFLRSIEKSRYFSVTLCQSSSWSVSAVDVFFYTEGYVVSFHMDSFYCSSMGNVGYFDICYCLYMEHVGVVMFTWHKPLILPSFWTLLHGKLPKLQRPHTTMPQMAEMLRFWENTLKVKSGLCVYRDEQATKNWSIFRNEQQGVDIWHIWGYLRVFPISYSKAVTRMTAFWTPKPWNMKVLGL